MLYARVSTDKQWQQGDSLEAQIRAMRKYTTERAYIIPKGAIFSEQFSGTTDKRPELDKAIEEIKEFKRQGIKISYFIIHKMDRGSRGWPDVHFSIKKQLQALWVELVDTYGIIQKEINVVNIDGVNTDLYDWAKINPSRISETMASITSQEERNAILVRTMDQQIRDILAGYWEREATFWFVNDFIENEFGKKKSIQSPHPIEAKFVIRIFELILEGWKKRDIVDELNAMGYLSRTYKKWNKTKTQIIARGGWVKLTVKRLDEIIQNPIYAWIWVVNLKWNPTRIVRQKYAGLVSIDTWNKANKWKKQIIEKSDGSVTLLHWKDFVEQPEIKRRFKHNPNFPFGNLVYAPNSVKYLNWNAPVGRTGTAYSYYSAKTPQKTFNYKSNEFESSIVNHLKDITPDKPLVTLYLAILDEIWKKRKDEQTNGQTTKEAYLNELIWKRARILSEVSSLIHFPALLEWKNKEVEEITIEIKKVEENLKQEESEVNLEWFKKYGKKLIENIWEIAQNTKEHEVLHILFQLVFDTTPTYDQIVNRNTPLRPFFALISQQKILPRENFYENLWWQPH